MIFCDFLFIKHHKQILVKECQLENRQASSTTELPAVDFGTFTISPAPDVEKDRWMDQWMWPVDL